MSRAEQQFTLHRLLWRRVAGLPRIVRVWLVLALLGGVVELGAHLGGSDEAQQVTAAVGAAVRTATGPDPAHGCLAVAPAALSAVIGELGGGPLPPGSAPLPACRALAVHLRREATPYEVADLAGGHVQTIQLRDADSATVVYLARDRRLGASLSMIRQGGHWLIAGVTGGELAGPD